MVDAAKRMEKYADEEGKDITHIYSYNKVMSHKDRRGISEILNRTNYRVLAWYFNPDSTRLSGLKHFKLIHQEPMQSTGKEKFTVYVYVKTKLYLPGVNDQDWADSDSDSDSDHDHDHDKD